MALTIEELITEAHDAIQVAKDGSKWMVTILNSKNKRTPKRHFKDYQKAVDLAHAYRCARVASRTGVLDGGWSFGEWDQNSTVEENVRCRMVATT